MKTKISTLVILCLFLLTFGGCAWLDNSSKEVAAHKDVPKKNAITLSNQQSSVKKKVVVKKKPVEIVISPEEAARRKTEAEVALASQSRYGEHKAKKACKKEDQKYVKGSAYSGTPNAVCVEEH